MEYEGHLRNWIVYTFVCQSEWMSKRQSSFQFSISKSIFDVVCVCKREKERRRHGKSDNWFIDRNHVLNFPFRCFSLSLYARNIQFNSFIHRLFLSFWRLSFIKKNWMKKIFLNILNCFLKLLIQLNSLTKHWIKMVYWFSFSFCYALKKWQQVSAVWNEITFIVCQMSEIAFLIHFYVCSSNLFIPLFSLHSKMHIWAMTS